MPNRCFMPPEKVSSRRLRSSQRLVCCSSAPTTSLTCGGGTPLSAARWLSMACADSRGYTPNSCGR